jgi:hypothetical protein
MRTDGRIDRREANSRSSKILRTHLKTLAVTQIGWLMLGNEIILVCCKKYAKQKCVPQSKLLVFGIAGRILFVRIVSGRYGLAGCKKRLKNP